jgi:hypothetical protein
MNYINNRPHHYYSDKTIRYEENKYGWNTNGIVGGGIGWKIFFKDNIHQSNLKIITLTNDGYTEMTNNLLISMKKLGLESLLKIYCIGEKSSEFFRSNYPFNDVVQIDIQSKEDNYLESWVEYKAQQNPDVEGKRRWADITSYKIYVLHQELTQGNDVIFIDGDIVFEKNPFNYLLENLESDTELLIQNDEQLEDRPKMCTGFFWLKSNENTIKMTNFTEIQKDLARFLNDQQYLRTYERRLKCKYLNLEGFPNGLYFREKSPNDPYIIHFNYDVSAHKIKRMKKYNKWYVDDISMNNIPKLIGSTNNIINKTAQPANVQPANVQPANVQPANVQPATKKKRYK